MYFKPTEKRACGCMKYHKPTPDGIAFAVDSGVPEDIAERGYDIFDHDCTGLLEVSRIDIAYIGTKYDGMTDAACAKEAERVGFCKIIPKSELPKTMPEDMKLYSWVDTQENRAALNAYCSECHW